MKLKEVTEASCTFYLILDTKNMAKAKKAMAQVQNFIANEIENAADELELEAGFLESSFSKKVKVEKFKLSPNVA